VHSLCSPSSDNIKIVKDDGMGSMCSTQHFDWRIWSERAIMEKIVRKIGHDVRKLFEMAHEMVPQRTFVSGVMNFLASNVSMTYRHSQRCIIFKG